MVFAALPETVTLAERTGRPAVSRTEPYTIPVA